MRLQIALATGEFRTSRYVRDDHWAAIATDATRPDPAGTFLHTATGTEAEAITKARHDAQLVRAARIVTVILASGAGALH
jgi:hypothetical protein